MVAAIAYRGETLLSVGYGTIKKGSKTVPDADTIFRIGSITKVFVVSDNSCGSYVYTFYIRASYSYVEYFVLNTELQN